MLVTGIVLIFVGFFFAYAPGLQILFILTFVGIYFSVWGFIRDNNKLKDERSQFLMMSQKDAQKYVDSIDNPSKRMKLMKDWQQNHVSTKL